MPRNSLIKKITPSVAGAVLFVIGLGSLGTVSTAFAQSSAKREPFVLLPPEGEAIIPSLAEEMMASVSGLGHTIQQSTLKLEDLQLAVGCTDRSAGCLQKIGKSVLASGLFLVEVRRNRTGAEVIVRWFDVVSGQDRNTTTLDLPLNPHARAPKLDEALLKLVGKAPTESQGEKGMESTGGLTISADIVDAEVYLNGQSRGVLPLELRNLPTGSYTITIRHPSYQTWESKAEVKTNEMTNIKARMIVRTGPPVAKGFFDSVRWHTWVVAGTGVACLVNAVIWGVHMNAQQHDFDENPGTTSNNIERMLELKKSGERDAVVANVFYAVGGVALVTSAILAYIDYQRSRPEADSMGMSSSLGRERIRMGANRVFSPSVAVGPGSVDFKLSFE